MTDRILETPLKGQLLGAIEFAEHLRKTKDISYTQKEIADVFGCGTNYVSRIKKLRADELAVTSDPDTRGRKRRDAHHLTQKQLAEKVGCSTATVSKVVKRQHPYDDVCRSGGKCSKALRKKVWVVGRNPNYRPGASTRSGAGRK
jgi:ParB-like chromosome segregation protein Spo0J